MTSQIAACVEKPKPRECKTVPEILAHYPTLQDYLSTVDMDEVILASRRGLGLFVHAYAQDGFRTVGDQIRAVVTAYCENTQRQALAATQEEGRRDMQTECLHVLAAASNEAFLKHQTKTVEALNNAHEEIRNLPTNAPEGAKPRYRHKKRGTEYTVIGEGKMQAEFWIDPNLDAEYDNTAVDMRNVVIYQGDDGKIWVRPKEEFEDGRFERANAPEGESDDREI